MVVKATVCSGNICFVLKLSKAYGSCSTSTVSCICARCIVYELTNNSYSHQDIRELTCKFMREHWNTAFSSRQTNSYTFGDHARAPFVERFKGKLKHNQKLTAAMFFSKSSMCWILSTTLQISTCLLNFLCFAVLY